MAPPAVDASNTSATSDAARQTPMQTAFSARVAIRPAAVGAPRASFEFRVLLPAIEPPMPGVRLTPAGGYGSARAAQRLRDVRVVVSADRVVRVPVRL